jgi:hypothetical protein
VATTQHKVGDVPPFYPSIKTKDHGLVHIYPKEVVMSPSEKASMQCVMAAIFSGIKRL